MNYHDISIRGLSVRLVAVTVAMIIVGSASAQDDDAAKELAASLEYTRSVIAKQHLIVHARFEPIEGDGKPVEFRYDRYPEVERIQRGEISYARKTGKKWLVSDDWAETGKPAKQADTREFEGWIALLNAPLENQMVSRDKSQGGLRVFRSGGSGASTITYDIRREHSTGMHYPKFTFTKMGDEALLKSFTGTMFLGEEKVVASMKYDYMISVNATVMTPAPAAPTSSSPAAKEAADPATTSARQTKPPEATLASAMRKSMFRPCDVEAVIVGRTKREVHGFFSGKNFDLTMKADDDAAPVRQISLLSLAWASRDGGKSWKKIESADRSPYDWVTALLIPDGLPAFEIAGSENHGEETWQHFRLKVDEHVTDESIRPHYWIAVDEDGDALGVRRYEGPGIIQGEVVDVKATYRPSKQPFVKPPPLK